MEHFQKCPSFWKQKQRYIFLTESYFNEKLAHLQERTRTNFSQLKYAELLSTFLQNVQKIFELEDIKVCFQWMQSNKIYIEKTYKNFEIIILTVRSIDRRRIFIWCNRWKFIPIKFMEIEFVINWRYTTWCKM